MRVSVRCVGLIAAAGLVAGCGDSPDAGRLTDLGVPRPPVMLAPNRFSVVHLHPNPSDYPTWGGIDLLLQGTTAHVLAVDFDVDWHRFVVDACDQGCQIPTEWKGSTPDSTTSCCESNLGAIRQGSGFVVAVEDLNQRRVLIKSCPNNCDQALSWMTTPIAVGYLGLYDERSRPLATDSAGAVRLLYRDSLLGPLRYAECASICGDSTSWQNVVLDSNLNVRDVAITTAPSGGVSAAVTRFSGTLQYLTCAAACLGPGHWSATTIDSTAGGQNPSIVVGKDGATWIAYETVPSSLTYCDDYAAQCATRVAFCSSGCTSAGSWTVTPVVAIGAIDASIAVDQASHPWLAVSGLAGYYAGARIDLLAYGSVLLLHCDSGCASVGGWIAEPVDSMSGSGWISLAMDSAGSPHLSTSGGRIDYAQRRNPIPIPVTQGP